MVHKLLQKTARLFIRPHQLPNSAILPQPAVILLRHNDLRGPLNAFVSLPEDCHIWVLDCFFHFHSCYEQYRCCTFSQRKGKKPKKVSLKAALAAAMVVPVVRFCGALPVYRGKRNIEQTFDQSIALLKKGKSLVIAADKDYSNRVSAVEEIYTGFFRLEPLYFKATGKHLPFLVLHFQDDGSIVCSDPLFFRGETPFHHQRKEFTNRIIQYLNGNFY